jgi:Hint domain
MAMTSETFKFEYELTGDRLSGYKIEDAITTSPNYIDPIDGKVTVVDPSGSEASLNDSIEVSNAPNGSNFIFIGEATIKDHGTPLTGIIVENQTTKQSYFLTNDQYEGKAGGKNGDVTITSSETTICFLAGTMVRTADGEVPVETLKRGDIVVTSDGRSIPVDWLGIQTVSLRFADKLRVLPIRIRAGALADNVPSRDLLVSPDHALLVDGALIQAGALANGTSIVRETNVPTVLTYYHVEVEDHSLILAENTPAETFVDNVDRLNFDNWQEHEALYPNGKQVNELPFPRAKSHRQVPVSTRVMLAARALAIGAVSPSAAVA